MSRAHDIDYGTAHSAQAHGQLEYAYFYTNAYTSLRVANWFEPLVVRYLTISLTLRAPCRGITVRRQKLSASASPERHSTDNRLLFRYLTANATVLSVDED